MYSFKSLSAISALAVLASTASSTEPTSTVSIPFPAVDPTDLGLSVVTVAPSSTVYMIGCALNAQGERKNTDCHWVDGLNPWLTLAPSSLGFNITDSGTDTMTFECKVSSTSHADCTTIDASGASTHKETNKGITMTYAAATITAGLEKLQATASSTPTSAASSGSHSSGSSASSGSATSTGSTTISSGASAGSAGASGSTSKSSGAAGARETGLGLLGLAGVVGAGLVL